MVNGSFEIETDIFSAMTERFSGDKSTQPKASTQRFGILDKLTEYHH